MNTEIVSLSNRKETGRCFVTYSPSGYGKSFTALSLPDNLLFINAEKKAAQDVIYEALELRGEPDRKVDLWEFETFDEYRDNIGNLKLQYDLGHFPYRSIFFDGLSFAQSEFKLAMEDDRFKDALKEKKRDDLLSDRFRLEIADFGGLASMMKRITFLLNAISRKGVNVVCTAWAMERPGWDKSLDFAPYFVGKEYSNIMMGYFNYVGMLVKNPNTVTGYPPVIRYVPTYQHNFLARAGNYKLTNNPYPIYDNEKKGIDNKPLLLGYWIGATELDYTKIIDVITSTNK